VIKLDYDHFLRIIIWTIGFVEILLGFLNYLETSKTFRGRLVSIFIWLVAADTMCTGVLLELNNPNNALIPLSLLAIFVPLISMGSVVVLVALFQSGWINNRNLSGHSGQSTIAVVFKFATWVWIALLCIPIILTLSDLGLNNGLYIQSIPLVGMPNLVGNFYEFTSGNLAQAVRFITGIPVLVLSLAILSYTKFRKNGSQTVRIRDAWIWMALIGVLAIGIVGYLSYSSNIPLSLISIGNFIFVVAAVTINIQESVNAGEGNGRIVYRILAVNLLIWIPLLVFIFVTFVEDLFHFPFAGNNLIFILIVFCTLFLNLVLVSRVLKPLSTFAHNFPKTIDNDFEEILQFQTGDEVALIARDVNAYRLEVAKKINDIQTKANDVEQEFNQYKTIFETIFQISTLVISSVEYQQLLSEIASLIARQFTYYHVGIYIIDDMGEYAILQAAYSDDGQRMLARGHKQLAGQDGIVGYVAGTGRIKIAQEVENDFIFEPNEDLPSTKAEMAFPLKFHGGLIGVLDIHSNKSFGFDSQDIAGMSVIANQVALAIVNSRRLQEIRNLNSEMKNLTAQETRKSWIRRTHDRKLAYRYNRISVDENEAIPHSERLNNGSGHQLEIPLTLRGISLGSLILRRDVDQPGWTDEDLALAVNAVDQIIPALENARLLEEIEQSAVTERLVSQVSSRIQAALDLESVMRSSVEEISRLLNGCGVRFTLEKYPASFIAYPEDESQIKLTDADDRAISTESQAYSEKDKQTGETDGMV